MSRQCIAEVMKVVWYRGSRDKLIDGAQQKGQKCVIQIQSTAKKQMQCNAESSQQRHQDNCTADPQHHTLFTQTKHTSTHNKQCTDTSHRDRHVLQPHIIHRERENTQTYHTLRAIIQTHITYIGIIHKYTQQTKYKYTSNTCYT